MAGNEDIKYAPFNFSWVVENQLAAMGWPQTNENMKYLVNQGIRHLITLSAERRPPIHAFPELKWTEIALKEFRAPPVIHIRKFIEACQRSRNKNEAVGVHCRMGRGRTGVMIACYLVFFYNQAPERAIINVRLMRPGSIETYEQEKAVMKYNDYLRSSEIN